MTELYFEDFAAGQVYRSAETYTLTVESVKTFAAEYDPQVFHLDGEAAEQSFFGGLAASGWQTAAIAMRLRVLTIRVRGGMVGAGVDEIRWTQAVRPGDTLRSTEEIVLTRKLASRPGLGLVRSKTTVLNQRDEVVMTAMVNFLAPLRKPN